MAAKQSRSTRKLVARHRAGRRKNGGAGAYASGPVTFVPLTQREKDRLVRHLRYEGTLEYGN